MYQILLVSSGQIVSDCHANMREAQTEACRQVKADLAKTPQGRRALSWCKNAMPWDVAKSYAVIQEMVGVWIKTHNGRVLPEDDEDCPLMFIVGRDTEKLRYGHYSDGEFFDRTTTNIYEPEDVAAFFVIPEPTV